MQGWSYLLYNFLRYVGTYHILSLSFMAGNLSVPQRINYEIESSPNTKVSIFTLWLYTSNTKQSS